MYKTYTDMSAAHQKEVDSFPMAFIFGMGKTTEEIAEELFQALGTRNIEDVETSPVGMGLILKTDRDRFNEMMDRHEEERKAFMSERTNLVDAITSEMWAHEYAYTRDPYDTLAALGRTEEDLLADEAFRDAFAKAEKKVLKTDY